MTIRITGMYSGLDTDSIVAELVATKQTNVDNEIKAQERTELLLDTWKDLNSDIYDFFTGTMESMRYSTAYSSKVTTASNDSVVSVITGATAVNSTQTLEVSTLAKAGYLTGGKLDQAYASTTKLTDMGIESGSSISVTVGDKTVDITVGDSSTIASFVSQLNSAGVNASYDEANQRFFISATETGEAADFTIVGTNVSGMNMLDTLGLSIYDDAAAEALQNVINTKDETITSTIAATEAALIDEVDGYEVELAEKLTGLLDQYGELLGAGDADSMDSVLEEIDTAIASLQGADGEEISEEDAALIAELEAFKTDVADLQDKQEAAMDKLTLQVDGSYVLRDTVKEEITAAVEADVAAAEEKLANLDSLGTAAGKIAGTDAVIYLNGVEFTSSTNSMTVNGLTLSLKSVTAPGEEIILTTQDDTSGIYDMICNFFTQYNTLINQMDALYNADNSSSYDTLTSDEKAEMSDSEIEDWYAKITDGILSGDDTLYSVSSALKSIMSAGITVNGKTMYLSDFGIETLGYFTAADNEKNAYHIAGADGFSTSSSADVLMSMISTDPDTVTSFFTQLSNNLYDSLFNAMKSTTYSSSYTVYDDKALATEISDYETSIAELQEKLAAYEEYWYNKFTAMEVALANMQSNSSAISSLFSS